MCERGARNLDEHAQAIAENNENPSAGTDVKSGAALGPEVKARIGHQLRLMYDEVANQGVPDRFAEILRRLDPPTDGGAKK